MTAETVRRIPDAERRARLARRHALAPGCGVAGPEDAARATVGLHATEPASVHLAALARCPALTPADTTRALHTDRTLVKALSMRRTLFAVTREQLPVVTAVSGPRVAHGERRNLLGDVARAGATGWLLAGEGVDAPASARAGAADAAAPSEAARDAPASARGEPAAAPSEAARDAPASARGEPAAAPSEAARAAAGVWLDAAGDAVLAALSATESLTLDELRDAVPLVRGRVPRGTGDWVADAPVAPRVLSWLSARGLVVRATDVGHWKVSRFRWAAMDAWLGEPVAGLDQEVAEATLVHSWLERYGPGTEEDVRWWLGSTKTVVRRALARIDAVPVELADGAPAWVAPGDEDPVDPAEPWVALLPVLDQSLMGWKRRDFYDGGHAARTFDTVGNGGPTMWADGRVVGSWHQDEGGAVELVPFERVDRSRFADAAARVEAYCDGVRVVSVWGPARPPSA